MKSKTKSLFIFATTIGFSLSSGIIPLSFLHNQQPALAQNRDEQTNIRVYEIASPAVVSVETGDGNGSGSIITSDGLVLTNAHVVEGYTTATVILADQRRLNADVVGFGENGLDLAVLKIRGATNLPTIRLAGENSIKVGQRAFAIGNPFGQFQGTFTTGIVSRIDSDRGLIQTDAAINPGNSGGPLLNSQGELIGVNTAIFTGSNGSGNIGIGFAISTQRVKPFLTAVRSGNAPRTSPQSRTARNSNSPVPQSLPLNGAAIPGRLDRGDNVLPDNSFFDAYVFEGQAGAQIKIDMASREIDPYLILIGPGGVKVSEDDDGAGGNNARIQTSLPVNGTYLLMANSYEPGESGSYNLTARTDNNSSVGPSRNSGYLLQEGGILGPNALILPSDGSLYQTHTFIGRAGQFVEFKLESSDFDTYLILLDPQGNKLAENDDLNEGDTDSGLKITLPTNGSYQVIVNSYDSNGRGRYFLTIR
ncbi:MAG: trypsin-like peptidase domain-containing protein [Spirulinaceae cyanobacterium]